MSTTNILKLTSPAAYLLIPCSNLQRPYLLKMASNQAENLKLANACLFVFAIRDDEERTKTTKEIFHPDIVMYEADRVNTGYNGLEARMQELIAGNDFGFQAAGKPVENHGLTVADWTFGPSGGEPVLSGTDITFAEDGKIRKLWVNFK